MRCSRSEGEGFGLPLIEAAQYGLPIIARDIPVFREVAGENAYYFCGEDPQIAGGCAAELAIARRCRPGLHWHRTLTWHQSSRQLLDVVLNGRWYRSWPEKTERSWIWQTVANLGGNRRSAPV